jgi:hypothetical protein
MTQVEVLSADRDRAAGYKVDVSRGNAAATCKGCNQSIDATPAISHHPRNFRAAIA